MRALFSFLLCLFLAFGAQARPVLVELYTSQGCASCPPADKLLYDLVRTKSNILPLSLHVNYWDYLGWQDSFGLAVNTDRQRAYNHQIRGVSGLYTPQMIIDGRLEAVGHAQQLVASRIEQAKAQAGSVGLNVKDQGNQLSITLPKQNSVTDAAIIVLGFDLKHEISVTRGENRGNTLRYVNVVKDIKTINDWKGSAQQLNIEKLNGSHWAVIVQDIGTLAVLDVAHNAPIRSN